MQSLLGHAAGSACAKTTVAALFLPVGAITRIHCLGYEHSIGPVPGTEPCPELRAGQPVQLHLEVAPLPHAQ